MIDGGAWIGDTAERFAAAVGQSGKVFAFEPTPGTFELLRKNTARFGEVEAVNAGLGAKEGTARFSTVETDTGSFHVVRELDRGGDLQVKIVSLDGFCARAELCRR